MARKLNSYPSDLAEEEWALVAPYLTLMREDAAQRDHSLRDTLFALRWMTRSGSPWCFMPDGFPTWRAVHRQPQCWIVARCQGKRAHDLRAPLRLATGGEADPSAAVMVTVVR